MHLRILAEKTRATRRQFSLGGAALLGACATVPTGVASQTPEPLQDYMRRVAAFDFTGPVFVSQDGQTRLRQSYGYANRAALIPFTNQTIFNIASFSKTLTATTVMRLVELRQMALDDTIGKYVSNAPAAKAPITVAQLLSHSAGLTRDSVRNQPSLGRDEALQIMLAAEPNSAPGTGMAYSNDGYRLLATLIERATQGSFRDAIRTHVFTPANMRTAAFIGDDTSPASNVAIGYNEWRSLGTYREWRGTSRTLDGAGSVVASMDDVEAFMVAYTSGRLVTAASIAQMTSSQAHNDDEAYGFGWFVGETSDGSKLVSHGGDTPGYHSEVRWYPSKRRIIALATTQELYDESGNGLGVQKRVVASNLSRILNGETVANPAPAHAPDQAATLLGTYQVSTGNAFTLYAPFGNFENLWIGADGQDAINVLQNADAAARARFEQWNTRCIAIANALVARDQRALSALFSQDEQFVVGGLRQDFDRAVTQHGAFRTVEFLGSRNEITGDDHIRTLLRMRFANGAYDIAFTWHGDALYETITDTGALHAVMLPVAQNDRDAFTAYDMVLQRSYALTVTGRGAGARLAINNLVATRA